MEQLLKPLTRLPKFAATLNSDNAGFSNIAASCDSSVRPALGISHALLRTAKSKARRITESAEKKADEQRLAALRLGYQQGLDEALSQVLSASAMRRKLAAEWNETIIETAVSLSEEIIGESLAVQPRSLAVRITRAINTKLAAADVISIYVHAENLDWLRSELAAFLPHAAAIHEDSTLDLHSARLELDSGVVSIDTREHLARIKEHLLTSERMRMFVDTLVDEQLRGRTFGSESC